MLIRIANMLVLGYALSAWGMAPAAAQTGTPRFDLKVQQGAGSGEGKAYQVTSSAMVDAPPAAVWRLLTDYDHLADYLPNLKSVRVVSRDGDTVILDQVGTARFLFFSQSIRLRVLVQERAPDQIDISLIEGDMKVFRASWKLSPLAGAAGTRLDYQANIVPKFDVPGVVGTSVVKKDIARMMTAVLMRLERQE